MKIKNFLKGFMVMTVLVLPGISMANTYQFIDTGGSLQSVQADNSSTALNTAYQLGIHGGVMLTGMGNLFLPTSVNNTGTGNYYQFVDTNGNLQGVWAANSLEELATAYRLGIHSGVIFVR
jgi:hypothetical protein